MVCIKYLLSGHSVINCLFFSGGALFYMILNIWKTKVYFGGFFFFLSCLLFPFYHEEDKAEKSDLPEWGKAACQNCGDKFIFMGNRARGKATFLNFPWKISGVLPLYPPWPCLLHVELVVWFWGGPGPLQRDILCKSSTSSFPEMPLHNWLGDILVFILRITTNAPVLLQANTGFCRGFSRFAIWDLSMFRTGKRCKQSLCQP